MVYFAASVDDPATNKKFAESLDADYPILSDPEKRAAAAYGVLTPGGFAARTTFYIAPDGKILEIDRKISVKTAGEDVARKLAELGVAQKK